MWQKGWKIISRQIKGRNFLIRNIYRLKKRVQVRAEPRTIAVPDVSQEILQNLKSLWAKVPPGVQMSPVTYRKKVWNPIAILMLIARLNNLEICCLANRKLRKICIYKFDLVAYNTRIVAERIHSATRRVQRTLKSRPGHFFFKLKYAPNLTEHEFTLSK